MGCFFVNNKVFYLITEKNIFDSWLFPSPSTATALSSFSSSIPVLWAGINEKLNGYVVEMPIWLPLR